MMKSQLEDLLYTLDLCAESLPFDPQAVHVRRLETIKAMLIEQGREKERKAPARVLSLVERSGRNDDHHRS
jgi:hypothetical protein